MRSVWWSYLVIWKSKLRSEANLSRRSTQNPEQHRRIFESSFLASWVIFTPMIWSSCLSWHSTPFVYCSDGDEPIQICILLKYISVISSIFVNKFAQKCQFNGSWSVALITVMSLVYFRRIQANCKSRYIIVSFSTDFYEVETFNWDQNSQKLCQYTLYCIPYFLK